MDYESARGHEGESETESLNLVPEIAAAAAAARSGGIPLLPNAENVVVLPEGVSLDDIEVRGRDLVIELPDGRVYVVPDGAIFVPVIVIDGVAVPPLNLAAYLIGEQPQPAAGNTQSSGGNFADPADPIQAAFGLGDLLPYTELAFPLAQDEEVIPDLVDNEPQIDFVPDVGSAGTEVNEAELAATTATRTNETPGSGFDGDAETASGVITFTSLDGVGSISIGGVTLDPAGFPQVVSSDGTGRLVVTAFTFDANTGAGSISYSYTLTDNTAATNGSELSFPIVLTDPQGDVATDTLVIRILDDGPTAFPNTNTVAEGATVGGNVLTDGTDDVFGADGPRAAGGVIGVRAAGGDTTSAVTSGTGTQIQGQFGTLTLNANGTYSYDANPNVTSQDVTDVFVYTIEDGDGDRSTTTLTITIDDVTGTLSDIDAIVDESGLDGIGSQIVPDGEFFTGGQITVGGATGPFTYTLTSPANGTYGTLTLNGSTGAYSYVLDTPFDGPTSNNGRNTINDGESFGYQVTDQNGNVIGTGTIAIDIVDDIPTAFENFDTVEEGGAATGNVLPNDIFGADGPAATSPAGGVIGVRAADGDETTEVVTGTGTQIQGEHGVLILDADGSYTYEAEPNIPDQGVIDVFVYTIEDGDGDRSTTTLTITIDDVTGVVTDDDAIVDESGLDGIGSQIVPDGEFFTGGQITVGGANGPFTYTLLSPANGTYGTLTLNGSTGAYSYVLDTPFDGPTSNNGRNTIDDVESVAYQVTDQNGNVIGTGSITIDIVDDIPTAFENFDTVEEGGTATGNVLTDSTDDVFGADGPAPTDPAGGVIGVRAANGDETTEVITGTGTQIQGEHGVLILNSDGSYTYEAEANIPEQGVIDVFVYTIEDGDGDRSTTTLTITIDDVVGTVTDDDVLVDESGLDGIGSQIVPNGEFDTGQITVGGANGPFTYTLLSPANGIYGTLTLNSNTGAYSYVLDTPVDGPTSNNGRNTITGAEGFNYQVTDQNGNIIGTGTINVSIVDDVPDADADFNTVDEGGSVDGDVLPNDIFGADGPAATNPAGGVIGVRAANGDTTTPVTTGTGAQIQGDFGTLTLNADGSYTYEADPNVTNQDVVDVFVYTIEDGDGDRSTTTLTIAIDNVAGTVSDSNAIVDESGLDGIGSQIVPNGEFYTGGQISVSDANGPFTFVLLSPANGTYGTLSLNGNTGAYSYTLDTPFDGPTANNDRNVIGGAEGFNYEVRDQNNILIGTGTITVSIVDDVPSAFANTNTVEEGSSVGGNVLTDDVNDIFGADGPAATNPAGGVIGVRAANGDTTTPVATGTGSQIQGQFGTLTLSADGSYTYEADADSVAQDSEDVFVYTIEDGDGDRSTTTLTITVTNADMQPVAGTVNATLDDDALPGGIADGVGDDNPDTSGLIGNLVGSGGNPPLTFSFSDAGAPPGFSYDTVSTPGSLLIKQGLTTVITVTLTDPATGAYTIVQNEPIAHAAGNDENNQSFAIIYNVVDIDGDPAEGTLNINVDDDTPTATASLDVEVIAGLDETATTSDPATFGVANIGDDPDVSGSGRIAYATSGTAVVIPGGGYGADGAGTLSHALTVTNASSGLQVTDGSAITLVDEGGVIVGRVQGGAFDGDEAFAIRIDAATGVVEVEQYLSIKHPNTSDPDDMVQLGTDSLAVTVTRTDSDGDSATAPAVDISGLIRFDDDGPTSRATVNTNAIVGLDETATSSDPATFGVASIGEDPDVSGSGRISFATSGSAIVTPAGDYGADGPGTLSHALSVTNASSGLQVTDGSAIDLVDEAGVIVGRVQGGAFDGDAAFAIRINAATGVVEVEQYLSLLHPINPDPDDTVQLAAGSLGVTITRTDGDGDSATSAAADISGLIRFDDDGPTANNDVDSIAGGSPGPATGNVITGVDIDDGNDANASDGTVDALGADGARVTFIDNSQNDAAGLSVPDGSFTDIAGEYGTLRIYSNGDYSYTRNNGSPGDVSEIFTYTLTDGDGDTDTATLTISIGDAQPSAGTVNATLDDDALPGGIADGVGDDDPDTSNLVGNLVGSGGDPALSFTFSDAGAPPGFSYDTSVANTLLIKQGLTTVITVTLTDPTTGAYTIVQNEPIAHAAGNDENNQSFAITYNVVDNDGDPAVPPGTLNINVDDDTPTATASLSTGGIVGLDETATSSDPATFGVSDIGDDPDVSGTGRIAYAISGTAVVIPGGGYGADGAGTLSHALTVTNANSGLQVTDGSAITLVNEGGVIVGRVQGGAFDDDAAFAIRINASTGVVEVEQYLSIKHPNTANPDDTVQLAAGSLGVTVTRTDGDGDPATSAAADISGLIRFDDDGPTVTASVNAGAIAGLDETAASSAAATFGVSDIGDDPDVSGSGRISFASSGSAVVTTGGSYGADGPGTLSHALTVTNANSGLQVTDGSVITLVNEGGVIVGRVQSGTFDDDAAFAIRINSGTGVVEVEQYLSIKHPNTANLDDTVQLAAGSLGVTVTRTDGDGDSATSTAADISGLIRFDDDGPTATASLSTGAIVGLDETAASSVAATFGVANIGDDLDVSGSGRISFASSGSAVVTAGGSYGADGPGTLSHALSVSNASSGLQVTDGSAITLVNEGGVIVGRVQGGTFDGKAAFAIRINSGTGVVEVEQYLSIKHPNTANPDDTVQLAAGSLGVTITRTDGDGDSATSTAADVSGLIRFDDDGPTLGAFTGVTVENEANATGNGTFPYTPGADGHASFSITGTPPSGISYSTVQNANGALLTATSNTNETIFTLQVNTDGTYTFTLVTPEASTNESISLLNLSAGGPSPFVETSDFGVEFTGSGSGINSSTQGFGVGNQFVGNGESFTIEFHDPGAAGDQASNVNPEMVSAITLVNDNINGSLEIKVTVFNDVLGTSEVVYTNLNITGATTLIDPVMAEFNRVLVEGVGGNGNGVRFTQLNVSKTILPPDINLSFNITATDGDGDTTSSSSLSVFVDAANPVVIDLDGDGAEFVGTAAGVTFDYLGGDQSIATAWAGPDDGILAIDLNGNGSIDDSMEIVFGANGLTDLEGLAAQYDTNHDGVLSAADDGFAKFGVWQDADSDGTTDTGEFKTLSDLDIVSIGLTSDGRSYSAADGDVTVHGEATYTRADGSTGTVADATFAVGNERALARSQEIAATTIAAGVLASAAIAETQPADDAGALAAADAALGDQPLAPAGNLFLPVNDNGAATFDPLADDSAPAAEPVAAESHTSEAADDAQLADLGQIVDHYTADADSADPAPGFDAAASESLITASDPGAMEAMQGLLLLAEAPPPETVSVPGDAGSDKLGAVQEALADAVAETFVDSLIHQLAANEAPSTPDAPQQDLAGLLAANVGTDHALGQTGFDFNQMVEEAQALAAA